MTGLHRCLRNLQTISHNALMMVKKKIRPKYRRGFWKRQTRPRISHDPSGSGESWAVLLRFLSSSIRRLEEASNLYTRHQAEWLTLTLSALRHLWPLFCWSDDEPLALAINGKKVGSTCDIPRVVASEAPRNVSFITCGLTGFFFFSFHFPHEKILRQTTWRKS